jgi:peptidoglycan/xylan/chitin deacetylase (PgdA/CDA1 family)
MHEMFTRGMRNAAKQKLLEFVKMSGGFSLARRALPRHLRILAYHGLWITPGFQFGDRLFMSPDQFERRMYWLKKSGYPVLDLDQALSALANRTLPDNSVVITIDDGWKSTYTHMLPILEQFKLPATVYITSWYAEKQCPVLNVALNYVLQRSTVAGFTWRSPIHPELTVRLGDPQDRQVTALKLDRMLHDLPTVGERLHELREICELVDVPTEPWWTEGQFHIMNREEIKLAYQHGLNIQLHTHRHKNIDVEAASLPAELSQNRSFLGEACGSEQLYHFCYPNGRYHSAASEVLVHAGIRSAVINGGGLNAPGADPYSLRRFLDGRSVTQAEFEAYMCGALDLYASAARRLRASRSQ